MPRSKNPETFGPEYEQLVLTLGQQGTLRIDMLTESQAQTMRGKYYSYLNALRRSNTRPDLLKITNAVSVQIHKDDKGPYLWFYRTEDAWDNVAIREALGLEKGFAEKGGSEVLAPVTATDSLREKLAEIRSKK